MDRVLRIIHSALYKNKRDEYYTTREEVEYIFTSVIKTEYLRDKIIYCFADSNESEFVKYLRENKDKIGYKDLWNTWDDYRNHLYLFEKADVIITNPPFSEIKNLSKILNGKKYFLFGSLITSGSYYEWFDDVKMIEQRGFNFNIDYVCEQTNDYYKYIPHTYIYNIPCNEPNEHKDYYNKQFSDLNKIVWATIPGDDYKYLNIDKVKNIPMDYKGKMLVPISVLYEPTINHFNILGISGHHILSDGRPRFKRVIIENKLEKS